MKAAVIVEGGDRHVRLTANHDDGVEVALLQFFHCNPLLDIDEVRLDPEPLENCQCSHKRAAIGQVDAHRLTFEIVQALDGLGCDDLHLLIVELGHIGKLLLDVVGEALLLEVVERVGAHDAEIDAL